ncbi:hypothetical protein [Pseudomonas phage vB_PaeM_PAO1_Ab17]|uniref:Major capsid protein n=1 Tax=Pseudomonas phage vB_PaeM_PAO1_Ab17 TaxID=1548904 RepID=A0A0A1IV13_9CAUD|nr:hypothetical protein [Pseudomonas phage vB_PaeM_PAO1_Ab17]
MRPIPSLQNNFEYTDLTEPMILIPNVWGLTQQLGIFGVDRTTQESVTLEEITKSFGLMEDIHRGARHQVGRDYDRQMRTFAVPHFTYDDYITPRDIQGKRAYGKQELETLDQVRMRKLERLRGTHAATMEFARMHTLVTGKPYTPNNTVGGATGYDWYQEFGKTRFEVNFELDTPTTNILEKSELVYAHMQDEAYTGGVVGDVIAICSQEFFGKLISHPTVVEAYKYYANQPQILRERLRARGFDARYREFYFGNVLYIEYRGGFQGRPGGDKRRYVPAGEAVFIPGSGTEDLFKTFFAPASKFEHVNTPGEESYAFEYVDPKGEFLEINSETNFIDVLMYPQLVVKGKAA